MMNEPQWVTMGYHTNAYGAECNHCGTVVELPFGSRGKYLLSFRGKHEGAITQSGQDELFAYVFYWTLEKLGRECDCPVNRNL